MFIIKISMSFSSFPQYFPETTYISSIVTLTRRFTKENGVSCGVIYLHFLHPSVFLTKGHLTLNATAFFFNAVMF